MNRRHNTRLMIASAGAVALLLAGGTAIALASNGADDLLGGTVATSNSTSASTPTAVPGDETIDVEQATLIALAHVGGGTVTEVERELEHGRVEWKIRVVNAGQRFDVRVDAATGAITRVDADRDDQNQTRESEPGDDRGGHGQDDPPGDDRGGASSGSSGSNSGPGSSDSGSGSSGSGSSGSGTSGSGSSGSSGSGSSGSGGHDDGSGHDAGDDHGGHGQDD